MRLQNKRQPEPVLVLVQQLHMFVTEPCLVCFHTDIILHIGGSHCKINRRFLQGMVHPADRAFTVLVKLVVDRNGIELFLHFSPSPAPRSLSSRLPGILLGFRGQLIL